MNEATLKERTKRLLEINDIIKKLDPTIRPAAFALLQDYVLAGAPAAKQNKSPATSDDDGSEDRERFFSQFPHDKPADNALLIGAYHYSLYGSSPFTTDEIKSMATKVGVTIPERTDMTFAQAQREGKNLFLRAGRGWVPTNSPRRGIFQKDLPSFQREKAKTTELRIEERFHFQRFWFLRVSVVNSTPHPGPLLVRGGEGELFCGTITLDCARCAF